MIGAVSQESGPRTSFLPVRLAAAEAAVLVAALVGVVVTAAAVHHQGIVKFLTENLHLAKIMVLKFRFWIYHSPCSGLNISFSHTKSE